MSVSENAPAAGAVSGATRHPRRGRAAVFHPHDTGRMLELEGAELASFGRRLGAYACDVAAAGLLFVLGFLATFPIWRHWVAPREDYHFDLDFHEWYGLLWFVLYFGLSCWLGNGKTLGKLLFGIRAVSLEHRRMTLWDSVERALGYGASTAEVGFGFLQYFTHANHRTLHDRIADTVVIRSPRSPRASGAPGAPRDPGDPAEPADRAEPGEPGEPEGNATRLPAEPETP